MQKGYKYVLWVSICKAQKLCAYTCMYKGVSFYKKIKIIANY